MSGSAAPIYHDPSKIMEEIIAEKRKIVKVPERPNMAPRDKIEDLRKEPDWLIPELRIWVSVPVEERKKRIEGVIKSNYEPQVKDKCLRFILTQETQRELAIQIVNFILPSKKVQVKV